MNVLLCLPTEILQMILEMLDSETKLALWRTCTRLREVLRNKRVMRRLTLSLEMDKIEESVTELAPFVSELVLIRPICMESFPYATFNNIHSLDLSNLNCGGDVAEYFRVLFQLRDLPQLNSLAMKLDIFYHRCDSFADEMLQTYLHEIKQLQHVQFLVHSNIILQCHFIVQIVRLCKSLLTLHVDVKECDVCGGNEHNHFSCREQAIPSSLCAFSVFVHYEIYYTDLHLLDPFCVAKWERISFNYCVIDVIELAATDQFHRLILPTQFVVEGDLYESLSFNFHRLYRPDLDTYYPDSFKSIASNVKAKLSHIVCPSYHGTVHSDTRQSGQIYCICPFSLPRLHCEGVLSIHDFNLTSVVPLTRDMRVLISTCNEHCNYEVKLKHVIQTGDEVTSAHLRHLSYLNLDCVPIIGDLTVFIKSCINIHTLVLTNHIYKMSYREIVLNLNMLPALRNFSCHDVSVSSEDLVFGCAKCYDLVNVELYFSKSLPSCLITFMTNCNKLKTLKILVGYDKLMLTCTDLLQPFQREGFKFYVEPRDFMGPPLYKDFSVIKFSEFIAATGLKLS